MNEKKLRFSVFIIAASLHIFIIFFVAFDMKTDFEKYMQVDRENARVMKLTDLSEIPPTPPAPLASDMPQVEAIAETMIETDIPPVQNIVAVNTIIVNTQENVYLPAHLLSVMPEFDESDIMANLVYPPIALRSGIEGEVILELFVARTGVVLRAIILKEEPKGRGFGEAATKAFIGRKGEPAIANGEAVSCRYRRPVRFMLK
jgi:TonB family protein